MGVSYLVLFLFVAVTSVAISDALRNVLFMPVDDLRPEVLEASWLRRVLFFKELTVSMPSVFHQGTAS